MVGGRSSLGFFDRRGVGFVTVGGDGGGGVLFWVWLLTEVGGWFGVLGVLWLSFFSCFC